MKPCQTGIQIGLQSVSAKNKRAAIGNSQSRTRSAAGLSSAHSNINVLLFIQLYERFFFSQRGESKDEDTFALRHVSPRLICKTPWPHVSIHYRRFFSDNCCTAVVYFIFLKKISVADLDPHGSRTFAWIRIWNHCFRSGSSRKWKSRFYLSFQACVQYCLGPARGSSLEKM